MISMTWPQYKRNECSIGEFIVRLTEGEAELLSTLLIRYPEPVRVEDLIEVLYPDPDLEPDDAEGVVSERMRALARKIGTFRINNCGRYRGYWLCQRPEDAPMAA